ncbi:hypothetical protein C1I89_03725 [Achromobacter pulmonis]|uniref:Uncharacterized protein n=1 Tax=Achromobacter pulmonis TaxID=1389932 RepID=A0A2N8KPV7_9BURK|nr:hypothetical protein C1I89_03725 [Achromobacter pulmonis]
MKGGVGRVGCVGCAGCIGCVGCIGCAGCVECIGCIEYVGCVGCVGWVQRESACAKTQPSNARNPSGGASRHFSWHAKCRLAPADGLRAFGVRVLALTVARCTHPTPSRHHAITPSRHPTIPTYKR